MTRAAVTTGGTRFGLKMDGHATGSEQVCAACSAIAYSLAGWLMNQEYVDGVEIDMSPGHTDIRCVGGQDERIAFEVAAIGLLQIAKEYPEYLEAEWIDC